MADNSGSNWAAFGKGLAGVGQAFNNVMGGEELNQTMQQYQAMPAQVSDSNSKAQKPDAATDPVVLAMKDPVKYANAQILLNLLPSMVQMSKDYHDKTGLVPDASVAFAPEHSANTTTPSQEDQQKALSALAPQPKIIPPQGAMTQSGFNPETGDIQEAGWVNRGIQGLAQGGVLGMLAGMSGPTSGQRMGATVQAQKLAGKERIQPIQKSEIAYQNALTGQTQAATALVQQEITGTKKMQPSDVYLAQATAFQKQIESKKTSLEAEKANLQTLTKTQADIIGHPTTMLMGAQGLSDIHQAISDSMERIKTLSQDIETQSNAYAQGVGLSASPKPSGTKYKEGMIYKDANGKKAKYEGGSFKEVQ